MSLINLSTVFECVSISVCSSLSLLSLSNVCLCMTNTPFCVWGICNDQELSRLRGFCSRRYKRQAMGEGNDDHLLRLLKEIVIHDIKETDS